MVVELKEIEHSSEIPRTLWNSLVDIDSYLDFWLIYRYYLSFNTLWSNLLEMIGFFNALKRKEQHSLTILFIRMTSEDKQTDIPEKQIKTESEAPSSGAVC